MPSVWEKSTRTLSPLICKLEGCQGPCIDWKRIFRCEAKWKVNKVYWSRICARGRGESTASKVGQLPDNQGEPTLNVGHWSAFIIRGQRNGVRGLWVICWLDELHIHSLYEAHTHSLYEVGEEWDKYLSLYGVGGGQTMLPRSAQKFHNGYSMAGRAMRVCFSLLLYSETLHAHLVLLSSGHHKNHWNQTALGPKEDSGLPNWWRPKTDGAWHHPWLPQNKCHFPRGDLGNPWCSR